MERAKTISKIVATFLQELWSKTPRGLMQKEIATRLNKSEPFVSVLLSGKEERLQKQKFCSICEFIYVLDPDCFTQNMHNLIALIDKELQKENAIKKEEQINTK